MQETQNDNTRQTIYRTALAELEKLQREIDFEKVASQRTQKQRRIRQQTLLAGGVLLSSLMSAVTVQMVLPSTRQPLSEPETTALHSLIDYVAMRQAANDHWVSRALCTHFGVERIEELQSGNYDAAAFYLLKLARS